MNEGNNKREINYFTLTGTLTKIGDLVHIQRRDVPDLFKKVLTIELIDGQKLFPEIRNLRLKHLDKSGIKVGDLVELEFSFEGSEKDGKRYNNIYTNRINKI